MAGKNGMVEISTRLLKQELPEGRSVKVGVAYARGSNTKRIGMFFLFVNKDGEETKLLLSDEAFDATVKLAHTARTRDRTRKVTFNLVWKIADSIETLEPKP